MFDPHPAARIRKPFQLIAPAIAGGDDDHRPDGAREREQNDVQKRMLLVEDEFLLSTVLAADLQSAGYNVVGPYPTLASALAAVKSEAIDAAILDINLKGELVYPVADELARRGIPFLFLSGYVVSNMPEKFRNYRRLPKPTDWSVLAREIESMLRDKHS